MPLNPKLLEAVYELLRSGRTDLYKIDQIYDHIESKVELSKFDRQLHSPNSDPNWKHDTRNLLGKEKTKGALINPAPKTWGLPREYKGPNIDHDICFRQIVTRSKKEFGLVTEGAFPESHFMIKSVKDNEVKIKHSNDKIYTIYKNLVTSRIKHLQLCGGAVKSGSFHRWRPLESAIVKLHPCIEYDPKNDLIFIKDSKFKRHHSPSDFESEVTRWLLKEIERMNTSSD